MVVLVTGEYDKSYAVDTENTGLEYNLPICTPTPVFIATGGPTPTPTFNPNDIDRDGIPNWWDSDADGDLIPNYQDDDDDNDGVKDWDDPTPGGAGTNQTDWGTNGWLASPPATATPTATFTPTPTNTPVVRYALETFARRPSLSSTGHVWSNVVRYTYYPYPDNYPYANQYLGWYPKYGYFMNDVGELRNDSGTPINVCIGFTCSLSTTTGAANFLGSFNDGQNYYAILNNNCVHIGRNIFSRVWGSIPDTLCTWMGQVNVQCPDTYANWLVSIGGYTQ